MLPGKIILKKVRVHNLKGVDLTLNCKELIVFTGVSGSGKSSLAFDTIFAEGQRRYVESLSTYARRHLGDLPKPEAESITGISPTIAIEQKGVGGSARSTVGTLTGLYDYLRVLYARIGIPHCPVSGEAVAPQTSAQILERIKLLPKGTKVILLSPYGRNKKGEFKELFTELLHKGFTRIRLDGAIIELSEEIAVDKQSSHDIDLVIDRLTISEENMPRLLEGVVSALDKGSGVMSLLNSDSGEETVYSQYAFSPKSGLSYPPLEPHDFSFNHPLGMCAECQGLGTTLSFNLGRIIDEKLSIEEDCCSVASSYQTVRYGNIYDNLARLYHFNVKTPWKKLSEKAKEVLLYGAAQKWIAMRFVHPEKKTSWTEYVSWRGILHEAKERYQKATSERYRAKIEELFEEISCPSCKGARIKPYPAATTLGGKKIYELTALSIDKLDSFFRNLKTTAHEMRIAEELLKEIAARLEHLMDVGLHYLSLDRISPSLSGGEGQRVRLSSQLGAGLVGAIYVLDEPSIGLHPRDNEKLILSLRKLQQRGNTVIVVEHDEETILAADEIVDIGPLAGEKGGRIIAQGDIQTLMRAEESLTGAYLSGRLSIPIPKKRRKAGKEQLTIEKASHHNLKAVTVSFPLKLFIAVTGVSGSGKSSLIVDTLYPALSNQLHNATLALGKHKKIKGIEAIDKVIAIDQKPIGRTPRSNPATYIKLFDEIRSLFSELPESKAFGFTPGYFSFNVSEGSCTHCFGMGMIRIDMDFMEDEWTPCPHCEGKRFDERTLSIRYKGKSIHDVLEMPAVEAHTFFASIPKIKEKLELLLRVGLDYLRLGQPSPTLSGGEAQRIKLAKELSRPNTGNTFYILDEPTTGLHFHDIHKLVLVLQSLVDRGNTVLVIEHNLDLIKTADWIIDLGPEGGEGGGEIVGMGTPELIARLKTATGQALHKILKKKELKTEVKKKKTSLEQAADMLWVKGASQNNLKDVDLSIPRGKITLFTGPSGSGKSSMAFDTIYAEGQRRYVESLSPYARQFVAQMPKPKMIDIGGLSPAIAIEQKSHAGNPRSTVGTLTEIYDFLRILYAHLGTAYCPETGDKIETISKEYVVDKLLALPSGSKLHILAPLELKKKEPFERVQERLQGEGYTRLRLNKEYVQLDEKIPFENERKNALFLVIDRLILNESVRSRLLEAIDRAANYTGGAIVIDTGSADLYFNLSFGVSRTGKSYPPITPHSFSFNTQQGMCPDCLGLGFQYSVDLQRFRTLRNLSLLDLMDLLWKEKSSSLARDLFSQVLKKEKIDAASTLSELTPQQTQILLAGSKEPLVIPRKNLSLRWLGLTAVFAKLAKSGPPEFREQLPALLDQTKCISCEGSRLNPLARHVRIKTISLPELCSFALNKVSDFITAISTEESQHFLTETLKQIHARLEFLIAIGIDYLSLDRSAPTLSNGEVQRIRLARQLGSGLSGCLYVLDEPTVGLHPHDVSKLNQALLKLCKLGNTLLIVEHDPLTIALADYLLDFGPGAGSEGGRIMAQGTLEEIKSNPASLTGAYLSGAKKIPVPNRRRKSETSITIENATLHNLKGITLSLPIGVMSCITGVSGSGKSTLLADLLQPAAAATLATRVKAKEIEIGSCRIKGLDAFDKLIVLDQNPIGHTIRADVSTFIDLLTPLRYLFAELPLARARGLLPKQFSFNHIKGMCTGCWGLGVRTINLQLLPPVKVTCDKCHGFRLNPLSLQIMYKGKHLGHILQMTAGEAKAFLPPIPKVVRLLDTLMAVNLGYLKLGQEIATLSGGEAQRLRLCRELAQRSRGKTLYLFDEPTIGLHSEDIANLLPIFHSLVDKGHTLILIEHQLDLIANADYLIELGPGAGVHGGQVIAVGTPEQIAQNAKSLTGRYLRSYIE